MAVALFGWVFAPLFAVVGLVTGVLDMGPEWEAAQGGGNHGTLTVSERVCGEGVCGAAGLFRSDDGSVRIEDAYLDEPPRGFAVGDRVRATYTGGRPFPVVFPEEGSRNWFVTGLFLVVSVVLAVGWVTAVVMRVTRRGYWRVESPQNFRTADVGSSIDSPPGRP
ncbi:hypothetical protein SAMN05421678_106147 [Actinopolymorpha cephalotaxi]|uniref:Uncharacterized protein n=1 Tax=Actinopolymorpha cephalotaxi TaxID=504797 RepID=A0A1I2S8P5_9ACTN|nr:hypothetical protein SAMN05421678_106147 [Actinopolymorpha cephalotaxi]